MLASFRNLMKGRTTSRRLLESSFWSVALRFAGAAMTFLVGVQLARFLGPAGFGIYGVVMGIVAMLYSAAQFGLPTLATREVAVSRASRDWGRLASVLFWFTLIITGIGLGSAAAFALVVTVIPGVTDPFLGTVYWAAPLVPIMALIVLVSAELRAFDRLVAGQSLEILIRPALILLFLIVLHLSQGRLSPPAAMAVSTLASALTLAFGLLWLRRLIPPEARNARRESHTSAWLSAALPLALTDVLRMLDATYATLIMGALTTAADTGVFRVAISSTAVISMPLAVLHVVTAPTLARLHAEGETAKLQRILSISAVAMFFMAGAGVLVLGLASEWLITILFGAEYSRAWQPLLILSVAQVVQGFFGVGWVLLAMSGGEKQLAACFLLSVGISIVVAVPLVALWGGNGAALAAVLGSLVNNVFVWRYLRRHADVDCSLLSAVAGSRGASNGRAD